MNKMTLLIRDSSNNRVGELDGYTEFHAIARYNAVGSWTLDMDYTLDQAALIDRYAGIVVMLDGTVVFSGPITGIRRERVAMKDTVMLSGQDDLGLIAGRLVLPDPAGPPYTAFAYDVRAGVAETIIKQYVNYNCGPLAKTSRRIAGLTIAADSGRGGSVTGRGRFDKMMDFLPSLATIGA
ncbi:MAG: hypothetical protein Q8O57_09185, partial [Kiritimatiellota bacterium]|nr:hypothetical protein [Kiritimatiellota bacterium]